MAKIIVTLNGDVLREVHLSKERTTIGRGAHNDVVLDHIAVSGEHAAIVTGLNDACLEDLNSTNGTQINAQSIAKHYLRDGDVIALAVYKIEYLAAANVTADERLPELPHADFPGNASRPDHHRGGANNRLGAIKVLNGAHAGEVTPLTKPLTTLGRTGVQVAIITREKQGYRVTHVEGAQYPLLNGRAIGTESITLAHGDVIELSGTQVQFSLIDDLLM